MLYSVYIDACSYIVSDGMSVVGLLEEKKKVNSSVKHFNPNLLHVHAECPETRKMLEPDF